MCDTENEDSVRICTRNDGSFPLTPFCPYFRTSEAEIVFSKRSKESELSPEKISTDTTAVIKKNKRAASHLTTQSLVKPTSLQAFHSVFPVNFLVIHSLI